MRDVDMWGGVVAVCVQFLERGGMCMGVRPSGDAVCHVNVDRVGVVSSNEFQGDACTARTQCVGCRRNVVRS